MELFRKKIGPVFLKEESDATLFIQKLQDLLPKADKNTRVEIEKQIKLAQYGEQGEKNIAFELKNSGMDMYILHDIYLEAGEQSAQIDFLVITRKRNYIIECKNLIGNIEINNEGNFIRSFEINGKRFKEGIYSPITQNQRHMSVIKELRLSTKNIFTRRAFENNFNNSYKSLVVLANPKTYLNARFAKKEVKAQVIRADQLIECIRRMDHEQCDYENTIDEMWDLAQFFLQNNKENKSDYTKKYEEMIRAVRDEENRNENREEQEEKEEKRVEKKEEKTEGEKGETNEEENRNRENESGEENRNKKNESGEETENKERDEENRKAALVKKLKDFRLKQSRLENIKPYYIFSDAQMKNLIARNPKTKKELLEVNGFGAKKAEKYGDEILKILEDSQ